MRRLAHILSCPDCMSSDGLYEHVLIHGRQGRTEDVSCPQCTTTTAMWQGALVPGSRAVYRQSAVGITDRGAERLENWLWFEPDTDAGCDECDWEGAVSQLDDKPAAAGDRGLTWDDAEPTGNVGYSCSCGWEGAAAQLVRLDRDGRPLPSVHPQQLQLIS